jgi:hypothetical protein
VQLFSSWSGQIAGSFYGELERCKIPMCNVRLVPVKVVQLAVFRPMLILESIFFVVVWFSWQRGKKSITRVTVEGFFSCHQSHLLPTLYLS